MYSFVLLQYDIQQYDIQHNHLTVELKGTNEGLKLNQVGGVTRFEVLEQLPYPSEFILR